MRAEAWIRRASKALLLLAGANGCNFGSPALLPAAVPNGGAEPTPLAKCKVEASRSEPLVTEWPASEKARLEALLVNGAIAVHYAGCELRIVDACAVKGTYAYERTTLSTDTTEIGDADDLYAKLPLGAVGLEGELRRYGRLAVRTTVAGQMKLAGAGVADVPHDGACAEATHLVTALSVGAYKLLGGGKSSIDAKVGIGNAGAGGGVVHDEEIMREAGDPSSCEKGTDTAPDPSCKSPLQIFLQAIPNPERERREAEAAQARQQQAERERAAYEEEVSAAASRRTVGWIVGSAGLAAGVAGGFFAYESGQQNKQIQQGGLATRQDIENAASTGSTYNTLAYALGIGGAVLFGVGVPFIVLNPTPAPPPGSGRAPATALVGLQGRLP